MAWFQAMERRGRLHLTVRILKLTKCIMLSCTKKRCDSISRIQMLVENSSAPHVRQRVGALFFLRGQPIPLPTRGRRQTTVNLVGAVGIEPSSPLQVRKLFMPRLDKNYKNDGNAEVRYTAGTWDTSLALSVISLFAGQAQLTFSKPL